MNGFVLKSTFVFILTISENENTDGKPSVAVTPADELWAVTPAGALNQRLTKTLQNNRSKNHGNTGSLSGEELEEEWEVI